MKKLLILTVTCLSILSYGQSSSSDANELVFFKLRLASGGNSYSTDIYFNDNATRNFDLGYDAQFLFDIPSFAVYSLLAEGDVGDPYALQAVNTSDLGNITIPIGVIANQGLSITFSLPTIQLPPTTEVYLDDTQENTSTLLTTTNYTFTSDTALNGTGRFFIRVSDPTLMTTYVYNNVWSPEDPNGIATLSDDIVIEAGNAEINLNTSCNSITVNPGAGLTVNTGITLDVTNSISLESTSTTYSSLLRDGTINGTINFERHVNINGSGSTGSNDLVSAPLSGQAFSDFATANPNLFSNTAGDLFLFGPFDKSIGDFVTYADTETATLGGDAVGYRAATDDNGTLTFTGTAENGTVTNDISFSGPTRQEWNLVGNPYPSYVDNNAFLLENLGRLTPGSAAIWGYDGSAINGWTIVNLATVAGNPLMAPGQGFFVGANDSGINDTEDLTFTPAMRSTGTSDDFIVGRNAQLTYLILKASTSNKDYATEFYFNVNAGQGLDVGYDAAFLSNEVPEFALYSHLVQENSGLPIALQALNGSDLSDVVIPLGVNANQGEQITFSIADSTLPESVSVYLEDTVANTVTLLNDSDYVITPNTDLNGTGRFYLRYTEDALSVVENSFDTLDIFAINKTDELVVSGQLTDKTTLDLYDIQGRRVLSTELDVTLLQNRINVANLNAGVYIVTLQSNSQEKTKKVILE